MGLLEHLLESAVAWPVLQRLLGQQRLSELGDEGPPLPLSSALVPPEQAAALRTAFDELGVVYDAVSVWRPT